MIGGMHTSRKRRAKNSPLGFPTLCPPLALPLTHRRRLQLVRDGQKDDILRVHVQVFTQFDRPVDSDILPVWVCSCRQHKRHSREVNAGRRKRERRQERAVTLGLLQTYHAHAIRMSAHGSRVPAGQHPGRNGRQHRARGCDHGPRLLLLCLGMADGSEKRGGMKLEPAVHVDWEQTSLKH